MAEATGSAVPVALEPRDGVFLKDGRGWCTSESNRSGSLAWPFGTTVRGALRAGLGYAVEDDRGSMLERREWVPLNDDVQVSAVLPLARRPGTPWTEKSRYWPAPLDAVLFDTQENAVRLEPAPAAATVLSVNDSPDAATVASLCHPRHAVGAGKPMAMPRFWSDELFTAWLCGGAVNRDAAMRSAEPLLRMQAHVSIDPATATAGDGKLFSGSVVEPLTSIGGGDVCEWAFAAVSRSLGQRRARLDGKTVKLGGDGRMARCTSLPDTLFTMPDAVANAFATGSVGMRLLLVGPASFGAGWRPESIKPELGRFVGRFAGLDDIVLHAACVGRPQHVSGWDVAGNAAKPTRRLVPAGSVYFITRQSGVAFTADDAEAVWLASVGETADQQECLGAAVPGTWSPDPAILENLRSVST